MTTHRILRKKAVATVMLAGLALIAGQATAAADAKARHGTERHKAHGARKPAPPLR